MGRAHTLGRGGWGRVAPKLAAFEPRRHALSVQSCNFVVRIGDMRGLLTRPVHGGNHCATDGEEQGERGSVQGECREGGRRCRERWGGGGFTLCVSAAVETTGRHPAQQHRRRRELPCSANVQPNSESRRRTLGLGIMAPPAKR